LEYLEYLTILKKQSNNEELVTGFVPEFISSFVKDKKYFGTIAGTVLMNMKLSKKNAKSILYCIDKEYTVHERNDASK
jgi:hypothetical protein